MRTQVRTGQVLSALVLLFMTFDGVIHLLRIAPVVDAFRQLGYPLTAAVPLGVVEIACVVLYLVPATRVIAAVLLTAYFGGAVATQVRAGADWFPVIFPVLLGVLLWSGLSCAESRVRRVLTSTAA
ncbi:MAG TPA: DoxX family protein [Vicinamibacterales bacterium]|nr:DoxX family protein [Vicinamibacterales bacterium]